MYQYIIFDLDGTLTDSKEGIVNCLKYVFEKMGRPSPADSTLLRFIGPPLQDSFMRFCDFTAEEADRGVVIYNERYTTIGKYENAAHPGMLSLCKKLHETGYTLALASSKPERECVDICRHFGFSPYLDALVGSGPQGEGSKADMIREAMRRLDLTDADRSRILMIGDRKFDVLGATECGIACAGVELFGYAEPDELKAAGAIAVFDTAESLGDFIFAQSI